MNTAYLISFYIIIINYHLFSQSLPFKQVVHEISTYDCHLTTDGTLLIVVVGRLKVINTNNSNKIIIIIKSSRFVCLQTIITGYLHVSLLYDTFVYIHLLAAHVLHQLRY